MLSRTKKTTGKKIKNGSSKIGVRYGARPFRTETGLEFLERRNFAQEVERTPKPGKSVAYPASGVGDLLVLDSASQLQTCHLRVAIKVGHGNIDKDAASFAGGRRQSAIPP